MGAAVVALSLTALNGWTQTPQVTISFPQDRAICRATVPFFGTATVRGGTEADFKEWRLEYGEGYEPTTWTRIASGNKPVKTDPWVNKSATWDIHIGASGNLGDWQTGLVGYQWGEWRNNLNGIYTARLVAELTNGKTAEKRLTIMIGEAIIRAAGGTAVSVDGQCRFSVPSFAHEGQNALVIAIIRYEPPGGGTGGPYATAETGEEARRPYAWVPDNLERLAPIYRIYPNGYETDPPSQIQLDLPNLTEAEIIAKKFACICYYSAEKKKWMPLKTAWFGKTASASVSRIPIGEAFFTVLNSSLPPEPPAVAWTASSALSGKWMGIGEGGAKLVMTDGARKQEFELDPEGNIEIPWVLSPDAASYDFCVVRSNGDKSLPTGVKVTPELIDPGKGAVLRVLGDSQLSEENPVCIECEGSFLSRFRDAEAIVGLRVQKGDTELLTSVELKKISGWSNKFVGTIKIGTAAGEIPPGTLRNEEIIVAKLANGSRVSLTYRDRLPPRVTGLQSSTHPAFFWSNPLDPNTPQIRPLNAQSGVEITPVEGALRLAGTKEQTTRMIRWPVETFSVAANPVIAFDYKSPNPHPWQILLKSKTTMYAVNVGGLTSYFPSLMAAPLLVADGQWHTCEVNLSLAGAGIEQVDGIMMGSWVTAEALGQVDPGFKNAQGNILHVRNLWVGKPSRDLSVVMQWNVRDPSGVKKCEWWVDEDSDTATPSQSSLKGEAVNFSQTPEYKGTVRFTLPKASQWYFHVIAEDACGNRSKAVCFPIRIDMKSADVRDVMAQRLFSAPEGAIPWEQPDGKFQVKLAGYGMLLDPKKTVLVANGVKFPVPLCAWDPKSEIMTIEKKSFQGGCPLGIDGEKMKVSFSLYDIAGRRQPQQPGFEIEIKSPFTWQQNDQEAVLGFKAGNRTGKWYATWEHPNPPWVDLFPGAVNNTLLVCQQRDGTKVGEKTYYLTPPLMWKKPVRMCPPDLKPVVWQETWQSPQSELLDDRDAVLKQNPSCPGYKTSFWTRRLGGSEDFSPQTVRVVVLSGTKGFDIDEVPLTKLGERVDGLTPGSRMRIDGWLHPEQAKTLRIQISDVQQAFSRGNWQYNKQRKRRMSYAYDGYGQWQNVRLEEKKNGLWTQDLVLAPGKDWTRFSVLIEVPGNNNVPYGKAYVNGFSYW
jgi:hypothetical protein